MNQVVKGNYIAKVIDDFIYPIQYFICFVQAIKKLQYSPEIKISSFLAIRQWL